MLKDRSKESANGLPINLHRPDVALDLLEIQPDANSPKVIFETSPMRPELRAALDELRQVIIDAEISKLEYFADTAPLNPKIDLDQEGPLSLDEVLTAERPFRFIIVDVEGKQGVLDRATDTVLFEENPFFDIGRRIGYLRQQALDMLESKAIRRSASHEMRRFQILREYVEDSRKKP